MKNEKAVVPTTWPHTVTINRVNVTIYRRQRPNGSWGYEIANYSTGKRRLEARETVEGALERAAEIAGMVAAGDALTSSMNQSQVGDYFSAIRALEPYSVGLPELVAAAAGWLKGLGTITAIGNAVGSYATKNKKTDAKRLGDVVDELIAFKVGMKMSARYTASLRHLLGRYADSFQMDIGDVTTPEVIKWLANQNFAPRTYNHHWQAGHLLWDFAVSHGYATENPLAAIKKVKVKHGEIGILTPVDLTRLLDVASPEFVPSIVLGAFAGLRSAEIGRIEWEDIHFDEAHLIVQADQAKTASRRVVPLSPNLVAWLKPYADRTGRVWPESTRQWHHAQNYTRMATAGRDQPPVEWPDNGLRHSYASYRFALTTDAGRLAGEMGNSPGVVYRDYRELVKKSDAERWFNIMPPT